jgi:hypothetical protein
MDRLTCDNGILGQRGKALLGVREVSTHQSGGGRAMPARTFEGESTTACSP